jgi:hypothetical protein
VNKSIEQTFERCPMRSEITRCFFHAMKLTTPHQLLELAIDKLNSGAPEHGLVFALRAVNLAASQRDEEARRRALNIASGCCVMSGDYADAIDYGLQSAALARQLQRDDAMLNALANVTGALGQIGFCEETVDIVGRVATCYADREDCREDVQKLLTNAANACLGGQYYDETIRFSREAIKYSREVSDETSAYVRMCNEFNSMKAAIALDRPSEVDTCFKLINAIATAYPTPYHQCNQRFACALYEHYTLGASEGAIAELEALLPIAHGFSATYMDVLRWLPTLIAHSDANDAAARVAQHRRTLVDYEQSKRAARIQRVLAVASASSSDSDTAATDVDVLFTRRWIESLIDTPVINARHPERTQARLNYDQQRALERIAVSARVVEDLTGFSIYRIGKLAALIAEAIGYSALESRALEWAVRLSPTGADALRANHTLHPALTLATEIAQNQRRPALALRPRDPRSGTDRSDCDHVR